MYRLTIASFAATVATLFAASVAAASPSGSPRTLSCAGGTTLQTVLGPGGFGTPYHVTGTTQVLVPRVAVVDGVTVINQAGAGKDAVAEITCSYTDPAGRFITVTGLLTG
jgi:hypothetical protein